MASYDARDEIADLQRLLGAAGIRPPYVLVGQVGHSYGGTLTRLFASEHPEETAGVVLDAHGSDATRRQLAIWPRSQAPASSCAALGLGERG
jgi:pimeloyl-ACP methyl ester carboxylesterase